MMVLKALLLLLSPVCEIGLLVALKAASWKRCLAAVLLSWIPAILVVGGTLALAASQAELVAWTLLTGIPFLIALAALGLAMVLKLVALVAILRSRQGMFVAPAAFLAGLCLPAVLFWLLPSPPSLLEEVKKQDLKALESIVSKQPEELKEALLLGAQWGKPRVVEWALDRGASVNAIDSSQRSLFVLAAYPNPGLRGPVPLADQQQIMALLVARGASTDTVVADLVRGADISHLTFLLEKGARVSDDRGACPALFALAGSKRPDFLAVVKLLLSKGASLDGRVTYPKSYGSKEPGPPLSPLCNAIQRDDAELACALIELGASVVPREAELSPLVEAAGRNQLTVVKALLERGSDPNLADRDGNTAWRVAGDPAVRAALEAGGARSSSPRVRLPKSGSTQQWLEELYAHNTSLEYVKGVVGASLPGRPPFDVVMRFSGEEARLYPGLMYMRLSLLTGNRHAEWGQEEQARGLEHEERQLNWAGKPTLKLEWFFRGPAKPQAE